jgi:hypothetical protein
MHLTLGFGCLGFMIGSFAFRFWQDATRQTGIEQKQCHPKADGRRPYVLKNQKDKAIAAVCRKSNCYNIVIFINFLYKNESCPGAAAACGGARRLPN